MLRNVDSQIQSVPTCLFPLREQVKEVIDKYDQICEDAYKKASEETQVFHKHWLDSPWSGFFEGKDPLKVGHNMLTEYFISRIVGCFFIYLKKA